MRKFSIFDDNSQDPYSLYFDTKLNTEIFEKVAKKCYLPTNRIMLDLISKYDGKFKISYSLTGVFLEQCCNYMPQVLDTFEELAKTGCVDFLSETYYHSLVSLFRNKNELKEQIEQHRKVLKELFNYSPVVFRNTEALFSNEIAKFIEELGYKGIITEGIEFILGWRSPNYLYRPRTCSKIKVLLRNYKLSDDVSYRFSARWWPEYPLTADKYAAWLSRCEGQCLNMFMDYETFGEHQWEDTGIFNFLKSMPGEILKHENLNFKTPTEIVNSFEPVGEVDIHNPISWADIERDTSAWLGNDMQKYCFSNYENLGRLAKERGDENLLHIWRLLGNSDHLYYMCTKAWADGDVHKYFSPFQSPYEGFMNYMNILQDFRHKLEK